MQNSQPNHHYILIKLTWDSSLMNFFYPQISIHFHYKMTQTFTVKVKKLENDYSKKSVSLLHRICGNPFIILHPNDLEAKELPLSFSSFHFLYSFKLATLQVVRQQLTHSRLGRQVHFDWWWCWGSKSWVVSFLFSSPIDIWWLYDCSLWFIFIVLLLGSLVGGNNCFFRIVRRKKVI